MQEQFIVWVMQEQFIVRVNRVDTKAYIRFQNHNYHNFYFFYLQFVSDT